MINVESRSWPLSFIYHLGERQEKTCPFIVAAFARMRGDAAEVPRILANAATGKGGFADKLIAAADRLIIHHLSFFSWIERSHGALFHPRS